MRKMTGCKKTLCILLGLMASSAIGFAAEEAADFYLDEMVVTATRNEQTLLDANANISVVTRKELENKHYKNLGDAIANLPGVNVQNMGSSGEAYYDNTLYLNGSKNVVFLIDGVRVSFNGTSTEKFTTAEIVDMDVVEKIEILKGSASTLYGSDAQGGVINIVTRKGTESIKNKVYYDYGSRKNKHMGFNSTGAKDGWNWSVGYQRKESNDFKDGHNRVVPENVDSKSYNFKVGKRFDDNNDVSVMYTKYESDYHRIKPAKGKKYENLAWLMGKKNTHNFLATYNHKFDDKNFNVLTYGHGTRWNHDSYTSKTTYLHSYNNTNISDQYTHIFDDNNKLIGGFEYTKDKVESHGSIKDKNFHNIAFYLQDAWDFTDKWNLTAGVRFDNHSIYGNNTSLSGAVGYKADDKTNFYGSYKQYFIAPTTTQLYGSGSGNADLDCETGYTYELGAKHYFDKDFSVDFNMYKRHSNDAIGLVKVNGQSKYTNYDQEDAKGFSVSVAKRFAEHFTAKAGYTYIYVAPQPNKNPNRNGYLPRGAWNLSLGYDNEKFSCDLDGRAVINRDGRLADAANSTDNITSFWLWNLSANYKFTKNFRVYGKVNNIFDTFYSERVYDLDPEKWYSSPGRNYMVGLECLF